MFITPVMDQVGTFNFETDLRFIDSLLWDFGDGTTSTEEQPTHTYQSKGTYEVTVTGFDICGEFVIDQDLTVDQVVNIDEINNDAGITISPNPNHGVFALNAIAEYKSIEIRDMSGRIIYLNSLNSEQKTVQLEQPQTGIYILTLIGEASRQHARLVIY